MDVSQITTGWHTFGYGFMPIRIQIMMLRITPLTAADGAEQLQLEGRLAGAYITELRELVGSALERSSRVALDLSEVTFVDADGARLLRELVARDVEMHGCSSFLALLLGL